MDLSSPVSVFIGNSKPTSEWTPDASHMSYAKLDLRNHLGNDFNYNQSNNEFDIPLDFGAFDDPLAGEGSDGNEDLSYFTECGDTSSTNNIDAFAEEFLHSKSFQDFSVEQLLDQVDDTDTFFNVLTSVEEAAVIKRNNYFPFDEENDPFSAGPSLNSFSDLSDAGSFSAGDFSSESFSSNNSFAAGIGIFAEQAIETIKKELRDLSPTKLSLVLNNENEENLPPKRKRSNSTHVRRPMNSFMVFSNYMRPILQSQFPDRTNTDISRLLGREWKSLDSEAKKAFVEKATKIKAEFSEAHPDFVYAKLPKPKRRKREDPKLGFGRLFTGPSKPATLPSLPKPVSELICNFKI